MFQRLIDDLKESTGTTVRMTSLAVAAAVGLFITISFLCAAAFVFVLQHYGLVQACLTGAAIFFIVTLIAAISLYGPQAPDQDARRRNGAHGHAERLCRPHAHGRGPPGGRARSASSACCRSSRSAASRSAS